MSTNSQAASISLTLLGLDQNLCEQPK
jgi:hypothetical protein